MGNVMSGAGAFVRAWDAAPARPREMPLHHGAGGHRNLSGSPTAPAVIFPRRHPQFEDSLEPGVRELVLALIKRFDCVTYSSCEGHPALDGTVARERAVDILPRDDGEHRRLRAGLRSCVRYARRPEDGVDLRLTGEQLDTEEGPMSALGLAFVARERSYAAYRAAVEPVYARLLTAIAAA
jgi:hypothetical protein